MLDELCREGKNISVQLDIVNKEKSIKFMGSMYDPNQEEIHGVKVNSWGNFNIERAKEIQLLLIEKEFEQHYRRMQHLSNPNMLQHFYEVYLADNDFDTTFEKLIKDVN